MDSDAQSLKQLASICSYLRKDRKPEKVIELTDRLLKDIGRYAKVDGFDRILCTRGAAFRDLGSPEKALTCALSSIQADARFCYAYNLAGASCYDLGRFSDGDLYFEKAHERGANQAHIESLKATGRLAWQKKQNKSQIVVPRVEGVVPIVSYGDDSKMDSFIDTEELRERELIQEELSDISESFHRSSEDGWYYSDDE